MIKYSGYKKFLGILLFLKYFTGMCCFHPYCRIFVPSSWLCQLADNDGSCSESLFSGSKLSICEDDSRSQFSPETKHCIVKIRNSDGRNKSTQNSVELEYIESQNLM